jgi:phosphoribosylformylglycinamidine (FGAM) synthase-like enzyme
MVGQLPDPPRAAGTAIRAGDELVLVGPFAPSLAGSELAKLRGELGPGLPETKVRSVHRALELTRALVRDGAVWAAHDVSDGGLACALAEMAIAGGTGLQVDLDPLVELRGGSGETCLFGEGPGGFVLAVAPEGLQNVLDRASDAGVDALRIAHAAGEQLGFSAAEVELAVPLSQAESAWRSLAARVEEDPVVSR